MEKRSDSASSADAVLKCATRSDDAGARRARARVATSMALSAGEIEQPIE